MRLQLTFFFVAVMAALAGCGSVVIQAGPEADGGGVPPPDVAVAMDDRPVVIDRPITVLDRPGPIDLPIACVSSSDCPRGQECGGPEGCGVAWTCQASSGRGCTDDLAPFCGCDGVTFRGSSSCPLRPYSHRGECATVVDGGPAPGACRGNVDCPANHICVGPDGCGVPWNCRRVADTSCTRDLAPFCACDGGTFMASSTCPGRPFLHRGACAVSTPDAGPTTCVIDGVICRVGQPCRINRCTVCACGSGTCAVDPACTADGGVRDVEPACPAEDARGVGACAAFFGYAWNGTRCAGLSGCSCVGSACGSLAFSLELCNYNHRACL